MTAAVYRMTRHPVPCATFAGIAYVGLLVTGRGFLVPVVLFAFVTLFRALFGRGWNLAPFALMVVTLASQNVLAGMFGRDNASASLHAAIALSALLPAAILFGGWWSDPALARRWLRRDLSGAELTLTGLAAAYAALIVLRWLTSPAGLSLAVPALRNALTPAYALLVVLLLPPALRPSIEAAGRALARWGVALALIGLVEFRVLGDGFWSRVAHVDAVIAVKRLSVARVKPYRVPADFYTYFGHNYFRRLVSLYGDAVTTSCYLALAILAVIVLWKRPAKGAIASLVVLVPALAFGAVKGAFGVVAVGLAVAALLLSHYRNWLPTGATVVLVACVGSVLFSFGAEYLPASSVDLHVGGMASAVHEVTSPIDSSALWGDGIGTGGSSAVYARRLVDGAPAPVNDVPGLDNGAGTILVQTGALGLFLLLAMFALVIDMCLRRAAQSRGAVLAAAAVTSLLCNLLLQEHALTLMTSLPFWIMGAIAVRGARPFAPARPLPARPKWTTKVTPIKPIRVAEPITVAAKVAAPEPTPEPTSAPAPAPIVLPPEPEPVHVDLGAPAAALFPAEDVEVLEQMLADLARADDVFQPPRDKARQFQAAVREARDGLRDFRRRPRPIAPFAAARLTLAPVTSPQASAIDLDDTRVDLTEPAPAPGDVLLDAESTVDLARELTVLRREIAHIPDLRPIEDLDVSRVGDPFGLVEHGRFLTEGALVAYRRYAYVTEFVDLVDVDVVLVFGAGAAEQVEVLKQLYPRLTVVVLDHPVGLYVAERFLTTACGRDVVPYRETRTPGRMALQRGKIHFVGVQRLGDLPRGRHQLAWCTGFFEGLDAAAAERVGELLATQADWVFVNASVGDIRDTHEAAQEQALSGHMCIDRRDLPVSLERPGPGPMLEDSFWTRRRKS